MGAPDNKGFCDFSLLSTRRVDSTIFVKLKSVVTIHREIKLGHRSFLVIGRLPSSWMVPCSLSGKKIHQRLSSCEACELHSPHISRLVHWCHYSTTYVGTQLYPIVLEAYSKKEILAKYCKPNKQTHP